jgi:hypothetical protein
LKKTGTNYYKTAVMYLRDVYVPPKALSPALLVGEKREGDVPGGILG